MNAPALVFFLLLAVAVVVCWRRRLRLYAAGLALAALLPGWSFLISLAWPVAVLAIAVAGLVAWQRRSASAGIVARWSDRTRRKAGVSSSLDIARRAGGLAMRRTTTKVRPSLAALPLVARWRVPLAQVGVELCRVGVQRVWASVEDVVLVFGGPRTGKTGWLAGRVLDAPGAAVVTSTRTDLLELCGPLRAAKRGAVWVFNPVGLGGIASTITFDPLTGCHEPVTAVERATDMVAAASKATSSDAERWDAQGRRVLAALLHAAALGGLGMAEVLGWVADNDLAAQQVPSLLRRSAVEAFERDATQFIGTNDRTRTSITNSIMPALGWLNHPAAAAAAAPGAGFDVHGLLAAGATVFLLGAEEAQTGPLVCALTGHIAREARRIAATMPSGRLDPPLTLALDEAALISPVPLENWTADMGGRGVTIIAPFQSRAQLLARYGEHKTATILNNTAAVVLFGGTRDRDDLQFWSTLAGERDEGITTTDMHGRVASRSVRKVAVFTPGRIANLPPGRVLVFRRGIDPVLGRARMAWRRRDVRAHRAGYPVVAGAPGWAGRLTYGRCALAHRTRPARIAVVASGHRLADGVRRGPSVLRARALFWWGRLRPSRWSPRAQEQQDQHDAERFVAAAADPAASGPPDSGRPRVPLRVVNERLHPELGNGPELSDPPTEPLDLADARGSAAHGPTNHTDTTGRWTR